MSVPQFSECIIIVFYGDKRAVIHDPSRFLLNNFGELKSGGATSRHILYSNILVCIE